MSENLIGDTQGKTGREREGGVKGEDRGRETEGEGEKTDAPLVELYPHIKYAWHRECNSG